MDPVIVVALVTGAFGTVGSFLKIGEKIAENRAGQPKVDLDRNAQVDANLWKYVAELKEDKDKARADAEDARTQMVEISKVLGQLRTDHVGLQALYQQSVQRIEMLEQGRSKDQALILELQAELQRVKAAQ
jgi:hypothetical protein